MTKTSNPIRPLLVLAAALAAAPLAAEEEMLVTGEHQPVYQERVSHADLDLRSWSHQQALKRRVHKASERVCIAAEGPLEANLGGLYGAPSCTQTTYEDTRPQIRMAIARAKAGQQYAANIVVSGPARTR